MDTDSNPARRFCRGFFRAVFGLTGKDTDRTNSHVVTFHVASARNVVKNLIPTEVGRGNQGPDEGVLSVSFWKHFPQF